MWITAWTGASRGLVFTSCSFLRIISKGLQKCYWKVTQVVSCQLNFFWQVKHLRTNYRVLDIEVDGGLGIPTIEAAAQVANDTVTALMFIQCNYWWPQKLTYCQVRWGNGLYNVQWKKP